MDDLTLGQKHALTAITLAHGGDGLEYSHCDCGRDCGNISVGLRGLEILISPSGFLTVGVLLENGHFKAAVFVEDTLQ